MLINIGRSVAKHISKKDNIKYYAQELKQNTYNLTRMNLVMRGIKPDNISTRNGDTLEDDWPFFDENDPVNTYNPLYVDAVVSNPPYSQQWEPAHKEADARFARFGLAPKTKADYAFLLHDLYHLKPNGIMTIVLPHGVLFRGGEEGNIRKNLIEQNHIDAIIGLPANIFFGTGIPTIIMVLRQSRENTDVLIVDASKNFIKEGKNNKLQASDIKRITDAVTARESIPKYAKLVSQNEIRENEYNLNIPRYVDATEKNETYDIYATMFGGIPKTEIDELAHYWQTFPNLRSALFAEKDGEYPSLKTENIKDEITKHPDVTEFIENYNTAFADFNQYLKKQLLADTQTVPIAKQETILSNDIFKRLKNSPLIDKYQAYQILDDQYTKTIEQDLEIMQTEGFDATKQVNPNMVLKKVKGKEQEVQDGYIGHIMPFDLVQETYLKTELKALRAKENRLLAIAAETEEIFESLSEDDKEAKTVNEAKDAFVNSQVIKEAKKLKAEIKKKAVFEADSYETKILNTDKLIAEEKALKKQIKTDAAKLHLQTKTTIENLTDQQIYQLLELKWISPLVGSLSQMPRQLIAELTASVQAIADKYAETYADITTEIKETEKQLADFIDELTGNEFDMQGLQEFKNLLNGE